MSDLPPRPYIIQVDDTGSHLYVPAKVDPDPEPGDEADLQITMGDRVYSFSPSDGEQLDSYTDPQGQFVQQCWVITHPDLPGFRAYYRPDEHGGREEWVLEYGDPWIPPPTESLGAYSVTITCANGDEVFLEAPGHYWFSRWRWQSAPRPVRTTHQQLAALNLLPLSDPSGLASGPVLTVSEYQPMSYCGIPSDQGQTGGYPGLGLITGWQAQYLTRPGVDESLFRNQAEAAGSFQAHCRDTLTNAPLDIVTDHPNAGKYSDKDNNPYIPKGPRVNKTDQGHMPSLSYVPFLLTGDPYYLESLQFWANENMLALPSKSRFMVAGRYLAWPLREIAQAYRATPESVPSWLLPKSYWQHWLDVCRGFVTDRMANQSDPFFTLFHTIPDAGQDTDQDPTPSGDHVWQQNMLELVAGWVASWDPVWVEPAAWLVRSAVDRASATSGWHRTHCSPYHLRMQHCSVLAEPLGATEGELTLLYEDAFNPGETCILGNPNSPYETIILGSTTDGLKYLIEQRGTPPKDHPAKREVFGAKHTSWCHSAFCNKLVYGWTDTDDNDRLPAATTDLTYPSYQRCALAQALHAGLDVPGLQEAYTWLDSEMRRLHTERNLPVGDNWTFVPNVTTRRRKRHASDRSDPAHDQAMRLLLVEHSSDE